MFSAPSYRSRLANGLRFVIPRERATPSVGVAVHYDVGFRSEPEGRTGFAHLFEHMMFQGSEHVAPADHFRHVQASGGTANGSTHQDYTDYYQVLPVTSLERLLYLEADRMRALRITRDTLRTQVAVVKEEIRQSVTDRPYGGFPWTVLPSVLYQTYPNAHNGYGEFDDLDAATADECQAFYDTYYTPGNAVLTICGDIDPGHAAELIERWFGGIPARPLPARADLREAAPESQRRGVHHDAHAKLPALAIGYRLPDPDTDLPRYLASMVLNQLLTGRDTARLRQALVHQKQLANDISGSCGLFGPLRARDPETLVLLATHPEDTAPDHILDVVDAELARLAADGPTEKELTQCAALAAAATWRGLDNLMGRTRAIGSTELLFSDPALTGNLATRLAQVSAEEVAEAAHRLQPCSRAVVALVPSREASRKKQTC
jgi:zinc protease